jgi:hypothetical protein
MESISEYLNKARFYSLDDARLKCKAWRRKWNEERRQNAIGDKCPIELKKGTWPYSPPSAKTQRRSGTALSNIGDMFNSKGRA